MRTVLTMALALLVTACGGDKDGDTAAAEDEVFAPEAGEWSWNGTAYDVDECGFGETFPPSIVDATMWDLVVTDDGYTLDNEIWTDDPIACTLTGMDFSCSVEIVIDQEAWPEGSTTEGDPDAVYTTIGQITGSFTDAESGTVSMTADITCEGADCEAYIAEGGLIAPCTTTASGGFARG